MYRFMRLPEVIEVTGLSETTLWRHERDGRFPKRRRIGPGSVAWRSDEVAEWMDSREVAEVGADPDAA